MRSLGVTEMLTAMVVAGDALRRDRSRKMRGWLISLKESPEIELSEARRRGMRLCTFDADQ
ncbi:hypothetical protein HPP92_025437 [Vanilla planifolia]|uniref:Uncharacterized protein n=1 Tax=Vanilla planifolia TaxID=51239 RepID=A0A835UAG7_VANPL|nr:hypothetical protein HPP92_025736 [Vanilla planifolia]KAG0454133.1 hypothetical protein HPP92_025437 [Vanilla planifolia]